MIAFAFSATAPTIGVAEFTPSAQRVDAPPSTPLPATGQHGAAGAAGRRNQGGGPTSASTLPPTTESGHGSAPTTQVGRSRRCFGDPPRQTEDPMSPPCVATIFEGDNGGATAPGVTATEIRVAIPVTQGMWEKEMVPLFEFINQNFELYGRRVIPVRVVGNAYQAVLARAQAADIVAQGVFAAVTAAMEVQLAQATLPDELTRNGVVTIVRNGSTLWTDRILFDQRHPYAWSVYPSSEDLQRNLGDFACTSLDGRPASHAGTDALRAKNRKFAVLAAGRNNAPLDGVLRDALTACAEAPPSRVAWSRSNDGDPALQTGLERLKADGVTTVICLCDGYMAQVATGLAGAAGFAPEWILTPQRDQTGSDETWVQSARRQSSLAPPMRIGPGPRLLPVQAQGWYRAMQPYLASVDPQSATFAIEAASHLYDSLLLLAAGLQGAGPNLTAASFAQALMSMQFPNPGAGQAPFWQPSVGFGPGDHSFYDDYNVAWWSDDAASLDGLVYNQPKGSWCYLQQGARFGPGRYPTDADDWLFKADAPCR